MQEPGRPFPDSVRQLVDWHFAVEHGPQQLTRVASDSIRKPRLPDRPAPARASLYVVA
jgi:hypothetical protein